MRRTKLMLSMSILSVVFSCNDDDPTNVININAGANAYEEAQTAFLEVKSGQTIQFGAGTFTFTDNLSMDGKQEIVIRGAGKDKTILDFSSVTVGGEGVLVTNSDFIRFEQLTVKDANGDALKARNCNTISFVNVGTIWSGPPNEDNGAYGLYPVLCTEVYIDNCYAYGASDAGIYVGQSDQVILKNSVAEGNVAGIEIENTTNADVFDNEAFDNTGGILVFDLPGLSQSGSMTRVFNNDIHDNNRTNFAPVGNIVGNVPAGTGSMILSTKQVEIFNNTITNNNFTGVLVANYLMINSTITDPTYDPFPADVSIHGNTYGTMGDINTNQSDLVLLLMDVLGSSSLEQPNIFIDGLLNSPGDLCIMEASGTTFININAGDQTFTSVSTDITPHDCSPDPLPEVSFDEY